MAQTIKKATRTMTCVKCLQPIRMGCDYIETDTGIKTHLFCMRGRTCRPSNTR